MAKDGTVTQADIKLGAEDKGTPKVTFSDEQRVEVAKLVTEAKTSALADVGRLRVEAAKALTAATAAEERIKAMERAREDAELDANQDNPAELRRIRAEQGKKKADDELVRVTAELDEKNQRLNQYATEKAESTRTQTAREVATRLNVDVEKLIKFTKFTDGSPEAIEDIAKDLPKITLLNPALRPDSNRSIGGQMTDAAIIAAYIKDPYDPVTRQRHNELVAKRGY